VTLVAVVNLKLITKGSCRLLRPKSQDPALG